MNHWVSYRLCETLNEPNDERVISKRLYRFVIKIMGGGK